MSTWTLLLFGQQRTAAVVPEIAAAVSALSSAAAWGINELDWMQQLYGETLRFGDLERTRRN
jgi:hypothetical protein